MAAIFEFDRMMPNGFVHRFLLLQNDDGIFTDIARGGPQSSAVGSEGLASGGVTSSDRGFGNLEAEVRPYHGNMGGGAQNDYFKPAELAELPSRLVETGTYQEMRQIFDGSYAETAARINAGELPYAIAIDNSNAAVSTFRAEAGQLTSRSVFPSIFSSEGGAFAPGYGQNLLADGPGLGRVVGGAGVVAGAGLLGYDAYQGYKTGDYSNLVDDGAGIGAFLINPYLGAAKLAWDLSLSSAGNAAGDQAALLKLQVPSALREYIVDVPASSESNWGVGDTGLVVTDQQPAHSFLANPYFFGKGIDLLAPSGSNSIAQADRNWWSPAS